MPVEFNQIDPNMYIGTVYGYNRDTRELEVYIPKLMPGIAENLKDIDIKANIGAEISSNLKYDNSLKTSSTLTVSAIDTDEPLPKIGSKVRIWFIESNINLGYWTKFNPDESYEVIDEEKYKEDFYLGINDSKLTVNTMDEINIKLPYDAELIYTEKDKTKTIEIGPDTELLDRITSIETRVLGLENKTESLDDRVSNIEKYLDDYGTIDEFFVRGVLPENIKSIKISSITNIDDYGPAIDEYAVYKSGRPVRVSYNVECADGYFLTQKVNRHEVYEPVPDGEEVEDTVEVNGTMVYPDPETYDEIAGYILEKTYIENTYLNKDYSCLPIDNPIKQDGEIVSSNKRKLVNVIKEIKEVNQ